MVAVHRPYFFRVVILEPHSRDFPISEDATAQDDAIVDDGDAFKLIAGEVCVDDDSRGQEDETPTLGLVASPEAEVGVEVEGLEDAKSIFLVGAVELAGINGVDLMDDTDSVFPPHFNVKLIKCMHNQHPGSRGLKIYHSLFFPS